MKLSIVIDFLPRVRFVKYFSFSPKNFTLTDGGNRRLFCNLSSSYDPAYHPRHLRFDGERKITKQILGRRPLGTNFRRPSFVVTGGGGVQNEFLFNHIITHVLKKYHIIIISLLL